MISEQIYLEILTLLIAGVGVGRGWSFPAEWDAEELGGLGPNDRVTEGDIGRITEGGVQREIE